MAGLLLDPVLAHGARLAAAAVFAEAGLAKWRAPLHFEAALEAYGLLPVWAPRPLARALPVLELLAAAALLSPVPAVAGAGLALLLLALFSAAIAVNLARGRREIDCGCGGAAQHLSPALLVRNGLLGAVLLAAAMPVLPRDHGPADLAVSLGLGGALAALWFAGTQMLANARWMEAARR